MRWLGLDWDEGPGVGGPHAPYYQSQRYDRHRAAAEQLVAPATPTTTTRRPSVYERDRQEAEARGEVWRYVRGEYAVTPERGAPSSPRAARRARSASRCPRAAPRSPISCTGPSSSTTSTSTTSSSSAATALPTYHLSVVCDDVDMQITHVIRGDDHVSNTPKHVLLFEAHGRAAAGIRARADDPRAGQEAPEQAPRRHLGARVPSARATCRRRCVNFLALLGWSPGDDSELFFDRTS